ncbi:hypothetical protein GFK88_17230 [Roseibium aggregatum]|nr:hypothetical protein GFK88_17230 [Roseibium aggregatum]
MGLTMFDKEKLHEDLAQAQERRELQRVIIEAMLGYETLQASKQSRLRRYANYLRGSPLVVGLEALGLIGLLVAVVLFYFELQERQSQRVAQAWQIITMSAPGNSGKIESLEYLNSRYGCFYWPGIEFDNRVRHGDTQLARFGGTVVVAREDKSWSKCWKDRIPLTNIDLSMVKGKPVFLRGVNLSGADVTGASFRGADLRGAIFDGAQIDGTDFGLSRLEGTTFVRAAGNYANFAGAVVKNANFNEAKMRNSNFAFAKLDSVLIRGATIPGAIFENAEIDRVSFTRSYCHDCNFTKAKLVGVSFRSTNLDVANFSGATLNAIETDLNTEADTAFYWVGAFPDQTYNTSTLLPVPRRLDEKDAEYFIDRIIRTTPPIP